MNKFKERYYQCLTSQELSSQPIPEDAIVYDEDGVIISENGGNDDPVEVRLYPDSLSIIRSCSVIAKSLYLDLLDSMDNNCFINPQKLGVEYHISFYMELFEKNLITTNKGLTEVYVNPFYASKTKRKVLLGKKKDPHKPA